MLKTKPMFMEYVPERLPRSVGIVCFYKGNWRGDNKLAANVTYLLKTLGSLSLLTDKTILYVCEDGLDFVKDLLPVEIRKIPVPVEQDENKPVQPVGKYALLDRPWDGFDLAFFTESDQVVYGKKIPTDILTENNYLSPHRMEKRYLHYNQHGQPTIRFDNHDYVLYNHYQDELADEGGFWKATTFRASYGAAWVARSTLLDRLDFKQFHQEALHSPCRVLFNSATALKTKNVFDFCVDHLSGFDNALAEAGHSIQTFPGRW